ncbi:MAG: sugar transferase [Syntrophaceae bacterium]|nr:sugar transferase [Syntrophaceae bacterium]
MFYNAPVFQHLLSLERKRSERSKRYFLLMLINISSLKSQSDLKSVHEKIKEALTFSVREVDICGWYDQDNVVGAIFTELDSSVVPKIEEIMISKVYERLCRYLPAEWIDRHNISCHVFPETDKTMSIKYQFDQVLYPDHTNNLMKERILKAVKSFLDFAISAIALIFLFPIFSLIAVAIKVTSRGPIFFRQNRIGLNGKSFEMLKFRSMHANCDEDSHKNYITKYIREQKSAAVEPGVFKLTNDNRITSIGQFLRKSSLDELPQLINVLMGDMSLVGPRPPLPYECEMYDIWHRRRLLSCKPGITGLWQVTGRSRTTFDEMVRLDLKYIKEWSLWLDLKILLVTPKAVLSGKGAH